MTFAGNDRFRDVAALFKRFYETTRPPFTPIVCPVTYFAYCDRLITLSIASRMAQFDDALRHVAPEDIEAMAIVDALEQDIGDVEQRLLNELRALRRRARSEPAAKQQAYILTPGQRIADQVAATMGSWNFIIIQTSILILWILLNITAYVQRWDPYPFILLNLALSFQAAYAAPFIMMSQNRQQDIDRREAANDYKINIKAELEIELLHQKIDELREREILQLTQALSELTAFLKRNDSGQASAAG